jgi:uncharacterized protein (DUF697 family)
MTAAENASDHPKHAESRETDGLFRMIDRLPFLGPLQHDLAFLRRVLYERRAPRIAAIGARGSGRTSLANALLRLPVIPLGNDASAPHDAWIRIDASGRQLDWIEIDAGPIEGGRLDRLRRELDASTPDLLLVVARADAPESEGAQARQTLETLLVQRIDPQAARPPVLGVVTHVDRVAAPEIDEQGDVRFDAADLARLHAATDVLKKALGAGAGATPRHPIPVLAGGTMGAATDRGAPRWNVEELAGAIYDALPDPARIEAARAIAVPASVRRKLAQAIVNHCSAAAVTIGLMPLPFSDALLLFPLQGMMLGAIAHLAGQPRDGRAVLEWLGSVGMLGSTGFFLRWGVQQLVKLIPAAGALVSGSVAGAGTLAMGQSAIAYFIDGPGCRDPLALSMPDGSPRASTTG